MGTHLQSLKSNLQKIYYPNFHKKITQKIKIMSEGRLYVRGVFTGFRGGLKQQHENQAIVKLEGVSNKEDCQWYLGKRVAYVYKADKNTKMVDGKRSRSRVMWGKIMRPHGQSGNVRVKFAKNMPAVARGKRVRVMLY